MNNFRSSFLDSMPPVVKNLIGINVVLWLATLVAPSFFARWGLTVDLTDILGMHYWASSKFNPAQLVTYGFMHGGVFHLFFNMFALYMFGGVLEQLWGTKRFLFYYLLTGLGAGVVQQLFWTVDYSPLINVLTEAINSNSSEGLMANQDLLNRYFQFSNIGSISTSEMLSLKNDFLNMPITVGASGSVFGLLLAFGWLFPEVRLMMLFFPVPIKARIFVLIYGVAELFLGVAQFSGDSVAHFAHLGGMLFGAILIMMWKKKGQIQ